MPTNSKRQAPAAIKTTKSQAPKPTASSPNQSEQTVSPLGKESPNVPTADVLTTAQTVNRKKQKRRAKQAARLAAEQQHQTPQPLANGYLSQDRAMQNGHVAYDHRIPAMEADYAVPEFEEVDQYDPVEGDDLYYTDDEGRPYSHPSTHDQQDRNGYGGHNHEVGRKKGKKKKGKKNRSPSHLNEESSTSTSTPSASVIRPPPPPPPPLSNAALRSARGISNKDRIWNTSTQEERENIKEFWLELGEEERRSLVKVEKEAVLRKMKEQQKHSCSCTVCGRKRTAIEEELEVLYDAYYEELEQYANHNQGSFENGAPIVPPPRLIQPPLRSLDRHSHSHLSHPHHASQAGIHDYPDDEDDLEEEYDEDEEDDEPYSDDELEEAARSTRADFLAFGNSLTVKDGILTVADDLLKNDGKHFIDMMEQLAERRMQREEDTQYAAASAAHQSMHAHNHGAPLDEEEYDEDDEEYDSQEDEEYEEDDMDAMTEEQRMEEGRRMFQIFAARMFEQRVLTAYREKVARERQQKLIEELEEESRLDVEREARKAREAQKRKDKKRLAKQAKEEEKARREAEKAAEEAAAKALEEKKLEEQRRKKEEQRKKKEAEKKAQEEERARKEAEKQKRLQEERERQAEQERKQREQKEREKKKREEAKRREREEREAKDKEARERKTREDQDRKTREEQARKEKDAEARSVQEARDRAKREEQAAQQASQHATPTKRASQSGPIHLPPGLQNPQGHGIIPSPHFPVATPVVPKAPTPARPRQTSQQGSHASSPRSQQAGTETSQNSVSPGNAPLSQSSISSAASMKAPGPQAILHHPQPSAPMSPLGRGLPSSGYNMPGLNGMPGMGSRGPIHHDMPMYANQGGPIGGPFRTFASPVLPMVPGMNGTRPIATGRGLSLDPGHPLGFHPQPMPSSIAAQQGQIFAREGGRPIGHSRQTSASFERSPLDTQVQTQPIGQPAPIKRPSSTTPQEQKDQKTKQPDVDELSAHLGSSALLDDTDVPLTSSMSQSLPSAGLATLPAASRMSFGSPLLPDPMGAPKHPGFPFVPGAAGSTWGPQMPFGGSGFPGAPSWGTGGGVGWSNNAFGMIGSPHRAHTSRPVAVRLMVAQACKQLDVSSPTKAGNGFHHVNHVLRQVEQLKQPSDAPIGLDEMLDICDTEGNSQNGGGSFVIKNEGARGTFVKFESDENITPSGHRGSIVPGDIGSPIPGGSVPALGAHKPIAPGSISPQTGF